MAQDIAVKRLSYITPESQVKEEEGKCMQNDKQLSFQSFYPSDLKDALYSLFLVTRSSLLVNINASQFPAVDSWTGKSAGFLARMQRVWPLSRLFDSSHTH